MERYYAKAFLISQLNYLYCFTKQFLQKKKIKSGKAFRGVKYCNWLKGFTRLVVNNDKPKVNSIYFLTQFASREFGAGIKISEAPTFSSGVNENQGQESGSGGHCIMVQIRLKFRLWSSQTQFMWFRIQYLALSIVIKHLKESIQFFFSLDMYSI